MVFINEIGLKLTLWNCWREEEEEEEEEEAAAGAAANLVNL